jgi:elongation factor Tu
MFELPVESAFSITGRGTVLAGRLARGRIAIGDPAILKTPSREVRCVVTGIEKARQILESASAGDEVGVLCREIEPQHLSDCYEGEDDARHLKAGVVLVPAPKRWWEFWRE